MLEEYNFEEWTDEDLKIGIELHIIYAIAHIIVGLVPIIVSIMYWSEIIHKDIVLTIMLIVVGVSSIIVGYTHICKTYVFNSEYKNRQN